MKLTDRQRKKVIVDYVSGESLRSIARRMKVAPSTIKRIVDADPETKRAATDKKEENTLDMLAYMDSRKEKAQQFIDRCIDEMLKDGRLEGAKLSEITTAMGTTIDKFIAFTSSGNASPARIAVSGLTTEELRRLAQSIANSEE